VTTETPPLHATTLSNSPAVLARAALHRLLGATALTGLLAALWLASHRYSRFNSDAQLYAFQALAKIHPTLTADLFLRNESQDRFTIFPQLYAWCVRIFGLEASALWLTVVFTVWFLAAVWFLARRIGPRDFAWLAVGMAVITKGEIGAFGVFHFSENFLTARLPAEALVVTALALGYAGRRPLAIGVATIAMILHPLMAFPGLMVVVCMRLPLRTTFLAAVAGVACALGAALLGALAPGASRELTVIDPAWLEVVRERAQFLFLQLWETKDWELNVRPFLSLTLSVLIMRDVQVRDLSIAALCVGIAGFAIAAIACCGTPPVALLLQGQSWRWVWLAALISVLLVPATCREAWRSERGGPLCALLLVAAWTFPVHGAGWLLPAALAVWAARPHLTERSAAWVRWATLAVAAVLGAWIIANIWTVAHTGEIENGREPLLMQRVRSVVGLQLPAVLLLIGGWYAIRRSSGAWLPGLTAIGLAGVAALMAPFAFAQFDLPGSDAEIHEFEDWRQAIPPTSSVFVADGKNSGLFVWFTLERPNYLTLSQSAGVVFSRATALEVKRRAEVLSPVLDPSWKIYSSMMADRARKGNKPPTFRRLTTQSLVDLCADVELGFVIAKENLDFAAIKHQNAGPWKDWNLYDCNQVRRSGQME
jgi:hypothetical protein